MSLKRIIYCSVSIRIIVMVIGFGLIFSRYLKSVEVVKEIPMIEAAAIGQVDRMKELLHNGESANVVDGDGNSPLAFALWNSMYVLPNQEGPNRVAVELLLSHQADARCRNKDGIAVIQQVVKVDDKLERISLMGKVIKHGGQIGDMDLRGYDVLQKNLETYDTTITEMMLDWWGKLITPEIMQRAKNRAKEYNLRDILDVLNNDKRMMNHAKESHEAHYLDKKSGLTSLDFAVIKGDENLAIELLSKGADSNKKSEDEYGMSPLHYAVLHCYPGMVDILIKNKANVNGYDKKNRRPLHMIAWISNPNIGQKMADLLVGHGAQIDAQDNNGNTVLHILVYNNRMDLINYGKKYGWNRSIKNNDRETPLEIAERLQRKELLRLMEK